MKIPFLIIVAALVISVLEFFYFDFPVIYYSIFVAIGAMMIIFRKFFEFVIFKPFIIVPILGSSLFIFFMISWDGLEIIINKIKTGINKTWNTIQEMVSNSIKETLKK
ncbi:hypothetical protein A2331_06215 [Candidatus Falkowbacteria bacterium RIFOXYB2_FULL_34_18]|uniref:Uncharacterized protein n=1 Tax=Candidatus Falkowbacteria bacterium RIFOXYD2_FULL_34_120 TaxID=1798007 RepID=A0A1F5TNL1_9BACT|nr:MAG: hypothetical protein A2331_06215 [Candidatus Falkowbacteria bacterium RIFOXYB2_FULL_34_18]OGF28773.1 MAG: hypothetical protein A2500_04485 [Candidatus Falkowbacteria bacterium RIFOXYC12_FULL_34_55]OGF35700.1 MAG: hypothetical protein A2466_05080 [Candidatus Falkowbacteria bacterium RIFOXYC2_FULL_34_220]OGF38415.1 MAG: hypothetical protein A2515_00570 [Candidatus Falkowbacteria bacterium RIFOXYD12_FULL_34_57]OGF40470.1 MAG: hypothetical protein A2531_03050 [Candidatus Falkowbacteria bact